MVELEPYESVCTLNSLDAGFVTCEDNKQYTDSDSDLVELKQFIKSGCPARITNPNLSKIKSLIPYMTLLKGCIMYHNRVVIPCTLQQTVLEQLHDGHSEISAKQSLARELNWYHGLDKDIENVVKSCCICQSVRAKPPQNRNIEWPVPQRVWSRIHIDHFFYQNKVCLIVVDALSRYIECEVVSSTSVAETIDTLRLILSRNGLCDILVSDNASCFTAAEFKQFLTSNGIQHITPPPYSPSSNGQAERSVRVMKDLLKKYD